MLKFLLKVYHFQDEVVPRPINIFMPTTYAVITSMQAY